MPVHKCADGKYRIGNGPCIYRTEAAAQRAYRAYLAVEHSSKTTGGAMNMQKLRKPIPFQAGAGLVKAYEEGGRRYLVILASDSGPDRQQGADPATGKRWKAERIAPDFIRKMGDSATAGEIELVDGHSSAIPLGFSTGVADPTDYAELQSVTKYESFLPIFEILANSADGNLLWEMAREGRAREFSIGGGISRASVQYDEEVGGFVRIIEDGLVNHVAVCRPGEAAVPRTGFIEAMAKALEGAGVDWNRAVEQADRAQKAYVVATGEEVRVSGHDVAEAEADMVWARSSDFAANLRAYEADRRLPVYTRMLHDTIDRILSDEEIGDKRAAMTQAVEDFHDEVLVMFKTAATESELRACAAPSGGDIPMKDALEKLTSEERGALAKALGVAETELEARCEVLFGDVTAGMDAEKQADLMKRFIPVPTMPPADLTAVSATLEGRDGMAAMVKAVADAVGGAYAAGQATLGERLGKVEEALAEIKAAQEADAEPAADAAVEPAAEPEGDKPADVAKAVRIATAALKKSGAEAPEAETGDASAQVAALARTNPAAALDAQLEGIL